MNLDFTFNVQVLNQNYKLRELSFLNYRNFVKNIIDDDEKNLNSSFNTLLNYCCVEGKPKNLLEKFLILLKLRAVIVNANVEISKDETNINLPLDVIFNTLNKPYRQYTYEMGNDIYYFDLPLNFIPYNNAIDAVIDCLVQINDVKIDSMMKFNIQDNLPALPINEIFTNILKHYEDKKYYINILDFPINFFDYSAITFLKSIYSYNLKNLYDTEYALRKHFHYTAEDFKTFSLPECNIMLNTLNKELAEAQKEQNNVESTR